ncbi:MAG: sugar transferase [Desulfobacteraceae bacterium]|nr:MAG: sugar transferase [Desulfobacteraceae bacterium]
MLKENSLIFERLHRAWDVGLTVAAFGLAYLIKQHYLPGPFRGLSDEPNYTLLLLFIIIIWYVNLSLWGVYRPFRRRSFFRISIGVGKAVLSALLFFMLCLFIFKIEDVSRIFIGIFGILNLSMLVCSKWLVYRILSYIRGKGYNYRNILIIGQPDDEFIQTVRAFPQAGYRLIGRLASNAESPDPASEKNDNLPVIGNISDIKNILSENIIDELIIADPLRTIPDVDQYIYEAEKMGINIHILPEWGVRKIGLKPKIGKLKIDTMFDIPMLSLTSTPDNRLDLLLKSISDYVISGIGLLIFAAPFLIIGIAIKLSSKGPVFFKQVRVGLNGRKFTLYKFRTMFVDADARKKELVARNEADGPVFKISNDPRIIPWLGTFLRKTSLDEMPQLINVFNGDMSLVGPRPPLPDEVAQYDASQRRRLSVKPGITCIWQTSEQRNNVRFSDWVKMDLYYIDNWSLKLDIQILFKTLRAMVTGAGR